VRATLCCQRQRISSRSTYAVIVGINTYQVDPIEGAVPDVNAKDGTVTIRYPRRLWVLNAPRAAEVTLNRAIEAMTIGPAQVLGLRHGTLAPGAPADLAVVDLDAPWVVREADIRSKSKNTCFEGALLQGRVLQTLVAGRTVFSAQ
jgi:dihydroorotase-like cyclic amidohydrolase